MKEINHVLFVVNPIAGNDNKEVLIDLVQTELRNRNIELTVYTTTGDEDERQIKDLVKKHKFDRVFIAGGDGTIKITTEAILGKNLPIAIFTAGSANGFAKNFDLPSTYEEQLKVALSDFVFKMDLVKINDHISLHLADFGVNAELIQNYDKAEWRGKVSYLMQSVPTLMKSGHPFDFDISTDGRSFSIEASVLSIANCQKYGTGACINPTGLMDDGKFEIIAFKSLNLIEIVKTFTNQVKLNPEFAETHSVSGATITCKDPVPFQIDGEYLGELTKIEISILEKGLELCVPESFKVNT